MEKVPDLEPQVRGGILEEGVGALLMTNEEYKGTLKWGQVDTLVSKVRKKHAERTKPLERNSIMKSNQDELQKARPHLQ